MQYRIYTQSICSVSTDTMIASPHLLDLNFQPLISPITQSKLLSLPSSLLPSLFYFLVSPFIYLIYIPVSQDTLYNETNLEYRITSSPKINPHSCHPYITFFTHLSPVRLSNKNRVHFIIPSIVSITLLIISSAAFLPSDMIANITNIKVH